MTNEITQSPCQTLSATPPYQAGSFKIMPYLNLCEAYVQFAIDSANEDINQHLRETVLRQEFPRLFRSLWWDLVPQRFIWKILFAKLGADGVLQVLIGFCRGIYETSWGMAMAYFIILKSECKQDYFRAWVNETPLEKIGDGLISLEHRYRVAFKEACLKSLTMGFGVDFKKTEEELRALVEKEAECVVLPLLGGFALRQEQFKGFGDDYAKKSSGDTNNSDDRGGIHD